MFILAIITSMILVGNACCYKGDVCYEEIEDEMLCVARCRVESVVVL